jgi:hypothetical protein
LLACIAVDDSYTKLLLIIPRKILDDDFHIIRMSKAVIRSSTKGYIDIATFEVWFAELFLSELEQHRKLHQDHENAVLILDNCSSRGIQIFYALCHKSGMIPLFLPPHSSNQL